MIRKIKAMRQWPVPRTFTRICWAYATGHSSEQRKKRELICSGSFNEV
uniref:Uncharacterized protein n=1 Tax=Utricularia reniformis TaxID=192314 RepID=A0A1Y0B264_9LAMI|nr:hypothetical protein AEK19_MT1334 [Utricularia reniformis]ART31532.1 hypothetical protein AEK19_MT1334 [Utricularia reniformis]